MLELTIFILQFFLLLLFLPGAIFNNVHQLGEDKLEGRRIRRQLAGNCQQQIVANGQVSYLPTTLNTASIGTVASGTTAVLTCNMGFVPQGGTSSSTCSNSIWNPPLGTCQSSTLLGGTTGIGNPFGGIGTTTLPFGQGQQCLAQMPPLNGQLQYLQQQNQIGFYPTGTIVQLICNQGSTVIGSTQSTCQQGQWQPPQLGQCQSGTNLFGTGNTLGGINTGFGTTSATTIGGCFPTISPANGQIQYQQLPQNGIYPPGTTATLTCLNGAIPTSTTGQQQSFPSTCNSGIWTPPFGQCSTTGTNFGNFGQPTGSTIGTGNISGNTNQYCFVGLLPPIGATLQYSNQFNQNTLAPTTQNSVFGNTLGNTGPYPPGTTATVICQQLGSVPSGQISSTCQNGQWVPPTLTGCVGGTGTFGQTLNNNGLTGLGTGTGTGQCLMGLAILGGNVAYTNTGGGSPTSLSTTATTNLLGNTQISQFGPFPQGTVAQAQCLNGQQPSGGATIATCISGQWQPPQLGSCLAANNQLFGGIGGTSSTFSPFQQFGQSSSTTIAGQGQQQCFFGLLPPLNGRLQYSNGQMVGPFPPNTVASILCNNGFVPNGQNSAICQNGAFTPNVLGQCTQANFNPSSSSSSTFSSSLPTQSSTTVKSTSLSTNGTMVTNANGIVGNAQCFEMPSPKNGQFVYSPVGYRAPFPIGSTATLVCAENTQFADGSTVSRSAICQYSGWSQLQFDPCLPTTSSTGGTFK